MDQGSEKDTSKVSRSVRAFQNMLLTSELRIHLRAGPGVKDVPNIRGRCLGRHVSRLGELQG